MPDGPKELVNRREETLPAAKDVKQFRAYARGRHRSTLSANQQVIIQNVLGHLFCDNACRRVLSTLRDRLRLALFDVDLEGPAYDLAIRFLQRTWTLNNLPLLAGLVHYATLRDGNAALIPSWRKTASEPDGRVVFTREPWWNGKTGTCVLYGEDGSAELAMKTWFEGKTELMTLYYPDRIERWVKSGQGWITRRNAGDTGWPVYNTANGKKGGTPLGVPVVHFRNVQIPDDPDDGAGMTAHRSVTAQTYDGGNPMYGISELDGGVLGLQDEVNDVHRDLTAAGRFAAFQIIWASGWSPPKNSDGTDKSVQVAPGTLISSSKEGAKFGAISAGELDQLIKLLDRKLEAIADATQVPKHHIAGDWPSGEALLRAEHPLVNKIENLGFALAPAWAGAMHQASVMQNLYGGGVDGEPLDTRAIISVVYQDPLQLDPATRSAVAKAREGMVSKKEQLRLMGYRPDEIERILNELEEEQKVTQETAQLALDRAKLAIEREREAQGNLGTEDDLPDDEE